MATYTITNGKLYSLDTIVKVTWYETGGKTPIIGTTGYLRKMGDPAVAITSTWTSKVIDCGDQFPQYTDKWKAFDYVRLYYEDLGTSVPVTIHLSTDGGENWLSKTKYLGTNDETPKFADYYFLSMEGCVGQHCIVKIESMCPPSPLHNNFVWTGFEIFFEPMGESFAV